MNDLNGLLGSLGHSHYMAQQQAAMQQDIAYHAARVRGLPWAQESFQPEVAEPNPVLLLLDGS